MKNKTKRIILEIPEEWHSKIKGRCYLKGTTIKEWVLEAIVKLTREEDKKELDKSK